MGWFVHVRVACAFDEGQHGRDLQHWLGLGRSGLAAKCREGCSISRALGAWGGLDAPRFGYRRTQSGFRLASRNAARLAPADLECAALVQAPEGRLAAERDADIVGIEAVRGPKRRLGKARRVGKATWKGDSEM